jgi:hypothetical protein
LADLTQPVSVAPANRRFMLGGSTRSIELTIVAIVIFSLTLTGENYSSIRKL